MCFSNLPLEFDEEGNPYLAEEADDVDRPSDGAHDHGHACDCGDVAAEGLATDPEGAYEAIVESLPTAARQHLDDRTGQPRPETGRTEGD